MNMFSKKTIFIFLVYLILSIGLTLLALRKQARTQAPPPQGGVQVIPAAELLQDTFVS